MNQKANELKERTHRFFVRVIALCEQLPSTDAARCISQQLLRSAGSTDSNYRAACKARSRRDFISKIGIAAEEADESLGWLRALLARKMAATKELAALAQEADELTSIFVKSGQTASLNLEAETRRQAAEKRRTR